MSKAQLIASLVKEAQDNNNGSGIIGTTAKVAGGAALAGGAAFGVHKALESHAVKNGTKYGSSGMASLGRSAEVKGRSLLGRAGKALSKFAEEGQHYKSAAIKDILARLEQND